MADLAPPPFKAGKTFSTPWLTRAGQNLAAGGTFLNQVANPLNSIPNFIGSVKSANAALGQKGSEFNEWMLNKLMEAKTGVAGDAVPSANAANARAAAISASAKNLHNGVTPNASVTVAPPAPAPILQGGVQSMLAQFGKSSNPNYLKSPPQPAAGSPATPSPIQPETNYQKRLAAAQDLYRQNIGLPGALDQYNATLAELTGNGPSPAEAKNTLAAMRAVAQNPTPTMGTSFGSLDNRWAPM